MSIPASEATGPSESTGSSQSTGSSVFTPATMAALADWDRGEVAELARVLKVISDFFTQRPFSRESLARFAFPGLRAAPGVRGPHFWTDELLGYLDQAVAELADLATSRYPQVPR